MFHSAPSPRVFYRSGSADRQFGGSGQHPAGMNAQVGLLSDHEEGLIIPRRGRSLEPRQFTQEAVRELSGGSAIAAVRNQPIRQALLTEQIATGAASLSQ